MTASRRESALASLQDRLGYGFTNPDLLTLALTHSSAAGESGAKNNERLEFLGDRVLALVISEWLLEAYPYADEGGLASRLNALVRREACADVAEAIGLGEFLILAESESRAGGRRKRAILANACEALIAALYLDGGLEAARRFITRHWGQRLAGLAVAPQDAKTALQEWAQGQGLGIPHYRLVERSGPDHQPLFRIEVGVHGFAPCMGEGASKRSAEQAAAQAFLQRQGIKGQARGD